MMKVYSEGAEGAGGEGGMPSAVPSDMPTPSGGTEGLSMPSVDEVD